MLHPPFHYFYLDILVWSNCHRQCMHYHLIKMTMCYFENNTHFYKSWLNSPINVFFSVYIVVPNAICIAIMQFMSNNLGPIVLVY